MITDPTLELQRARRRYFRRAIIDLICMVVLLGIIFKQAERLESREQIQVTNERAIVNLEKVEQELLRECALPTPVTVPDPAAPTLPELVHDESQRLR